ncbi:hypothetical protein [Bacillus sp. JJ1562]|uniref:hypothetical protein n=1 Tax=Bacillus sp. JJ1562 TaxID=3122960 RepID=UPI00300360B8
MDMEKSIYVEIFCMPLRKSGNITKKEKYNKIQEGNMEKGHYNEDANLKRKESETLEISSTGYGLESVSKENEDEYRLEQRNSHLRSILQN